MLILNSLVTVKFKLLSNMMPNLLFSKLFFFIKMKLISYQCFFIALTVNLLYIVYQYLCMI